MADLEAAMGVESDSVLRLPLRHLAVGTVSLPFGAFILCIYLSVRYDFDLATATHCGVPNYLPSISSAIGEFIPQRYIWRAAIALHSAPRFLLAAMYFNFNKRVMPNYRFYQNAVKVNTVLNVVENLALLGLSFVSSKENYDLHKVFFVVFMVCSECYMLLTFLLLRDQKFRLTSHLERQAFNIKRNLMKANIVSFFVALYFFYRHNTYCEPGMYSVFAFLEYLVVLTNMAFHMAAYYDFHGHSLVVGTDISSPPTTTDPVRAGGLS
ncbi:acyltransferase PGAP2-like isoform X4 [Oratosquilla oratoria]|uniref:acyltransferase PGAP2-like isoform X4 n=1 Tax=Oratosquilla oratoria TaxID=337810 RepID=UPI003F763520